ncbi:ATP-binding protein [Streptomyces sp. NPDC021080]|uniref:ATP-binding protein n=1 Tax=Streptomyces sp. NPDC021080 TaxID=3365110 RepID=UPI0037946D8A
MHSPSHQAPPPLGALKHLIYRQRYPGDPANVARARHRLAGAADLAGLDADLAETALVCLSELTTNAVVHAQLPFNVMVSIGGQRRRYLQVGVHDTDEDHLPHLPSNRDDAEEYLDDLSYEQETGLRGLAMVVMLADRSGVESDVNGKTVWFRLYLDRKGVADVPGPREGAASFLR